MNKKGFTLVELIAVVVIMAIIAMIATPNIISLIDNGKRSDYIADAKSFIAKAKYMEKLEKYNKQGGDSEDSYFTKEGDGIKKILLSKIVNINDFNDPYGGEYKKGESYVKFKIATENGINVKEASIYLKSGDGDNCHIIYETPETELTNDSVKK